jgi:hypothetical protein
MRAAEARARADEMKEVEPKAIMFRIAADYDRLAKWAEENSIPWWEKKRGEQVGTTANVAKLPEQLISGAFRINQSSRSL